MLTERSTTVTVPPMGFHVPAERTTEPACSGLVHSVSFRRQEKLVTNQGSQGSEARLTVDINVVHSKVGQGTR